MRGKSHRRFWEFIDRQHGVVTRPQLLMLGFSPKVIERAVSNGRLFPLWAGVYSVGRPGVSREGRWLAAVLACGPYAVLSHASAGALWRIAACELGHVEVSVPAGSIRRRPGIRVRRRNCLPEEPSWRQEGIPVTSPVRTLLDLAPRLSRARLERAVNEAANLDLVSPDDLRDELERHTGQRGVGLLRAVLDRRTFRLTDSELERLFLPLGRRAGLPMPRTRAHVNGFRVDFYWAALGLVAETDGLRYHRTPAQQARDRLRDQAHAATGLTVVRFTHEQVRYEPEHVVRVLAEVSKHLPRMRG